MDKKQVKKVLRKIYDLLDELEDNLFKNEVVEIDEVVEEDEEDE